MASDDKPITHKWVRRRTPEPKPVDDEVPVLEVRAPAGRAPEADDLADRITAALVGWPILHMRLTGSLQATARFGRNPGRWARQHVLKAVDDALCTCPGLRCTRAECRAGRLLGRHGKEGGPDGEAWSPMALRPADMPNGSMDKGDVRVEVVLAGAEATSLGGDFAAALRGDVGGPVRWTAVQALVWGAGELRWRKVQEEGPPPLLALDEVTTPRLGRQRLTLGFLTATPIARQGEVGTPKPDLALFVDRMSRTLGAWMGRTAHKGPRLPVDDMLRAAGEATIAADHTRVIQVPGMLLGAAGQQGSMDDRVPAMTGSITWKGQFGGLAPLLRAAHYVGMGPGRQHGLGQIGVR